MPGHQGNPRKGLHHCFTCPSPSPSIHPHLAMALAEHFALWSKRPHLPGDHTMHSPCEPAPCLASLLTPTSKWRQLSFSPWPLSLLTAHSHPWLQLSPLGTEFANLQLSPRLGLKLQPPAKCTPVDFPSQTQIQREKPEASLSFPMDQHHLCMFKPPKSVFSCSFVAKSYLILCDPMDCSTPGSPVLHHGPQLLVLDPLHGSQP